MAISVDPATNVISVPQADLTFISGTLYELDVNWLRTQLKDYEDSVDGIVKADTHSHNTEVVLSGVTYARTVEILSPYTVEFEDGQYEVRCVGANHNLADVKVANQVSLIVGNSAGLIVKGLEYSSYDQGLIEDMELRMKWMYNRQVLDADGVLTLYDDDGVTVLDQKQLYTVSGSKYIPPDDVPAERRDL